ncbi:sigma-70 family RNA polymerase sigma factor [Pseudogracilibacillus sp. SO10305]|uniref:sigma-70 family RNA polymerase sigma factor n=1 Tax=Pseudogracilibacillus sp. SO10305 TaxID=3098292 RepID=UPI00300DDB49
MEKITKKAIAGDKEAFILLIDTVKADIYRTAFSYMKTEELALEVVQEVTYRALINIHSIRQPAYIKTWFIRITINYCNDLIRERKKVLQLEETMIPSAYEKDFLLLEMEELLEKLSNQEREWIVLKYIHGISFKEMAEVFRTNENTMKTRVYKTLDKLRHLAKKGEV